MTDGPDSAKTPTRPPLPQADPPTSPPSAPDAPTLVHGSAKDTSSFEKTIVTGPAPASTHGPRIPERLGPYTLLGELGRGGMGIVFRARHATLGTECAVKVLIAGEHASEESIARFHREAAGVARLGKHPNIAHVFDLGWDGPLAYYAMELVGGRSLRQLLRERLLDIREAAGLMERVARALHFAHQHGLIHRDVKPNNILLREDGEPQVVDFGLARDMGSAQQWSVTGDIMGTPEYMSPEQAGGLVDETDARTDVYAMGAVLYECLAGIPPHRGETWPELLQDILDGEVVPLAKLRAGVPQDLETICLKCLELRREGRYATAEALADDLARFRNGEPVHARPVSAPERLRRRAVKHWRVVLPTSVAAVLALGIGAWALSVATRDAGALAGALEMGGKYRAENRPREARDMFHEARRIDGANAEAIAGLRWADDELARLDRKAEDERRRADEAEALLAKSRLVIRVLGRWGRLHRPLREMERAAYSNALPQELRARNLRAWTQVEAFMHETPDDPTSRAAMLALAGWARRLSGYPDEGVRWMQEASRIDPDVPYGPLMEALVRFSRFVEAYPLPDLSIAEQGLEIGEAPEAPPEVAAERDLIPPLLAQAKQARIFGEEGAEGFGVAIEAMTAMQAGDYAAAERHLDDALGRPELIAFESGLLLARARARYLQEKIGAALEDARDVVSARPEQPEAHVVLGQVLYAQAIAILFARKDPRPALTESIEAFTRADALRPGGYSALNNRGSAWLCLGDVERDAGLPPAEHYKKALADFEEALRRAPQLGLGVNNRGNAHARLGEWIERQGRDPRQEYRLALADYERTLALGPQYAFAVFNRAQVRVCLAHAERLHDGDPEPFLVEALKDFDAYLALRPGSLSGTVARATVHVERGAAKAARGDDPREDFRAAVLALGEAIEARPDFAKARYNRGQAWLLLGKWDADHEGDFRASFARGLAEFQEMVRIAPDDPTGYEGRATARLNLTEVLFRREEDADHLLAQGIADLEEALTRGAPRLGTQARLGKAHARRADALRAGGQDPAPELRASIAALDEAVRIAPDHVEHRALRGQQRAALAAVLALRDEDVRDLARGAIGDLGAAIEADPEDTAARLRRAVTGAMLAVQELEHEEAPDASFRAAFEDFAEVVRQDPDDVETRVRYAEALRRYGSIRMQSGQDGIRLFADAVAQLDEAILRAPSHPQILVARSGILQSAAWLKANAGFDPGDLFERSLSDATEAVRLLPDAPLAHVILGDALCGPAKRAWLRGEVDREACRGAIEAYDRAVELDPSLLDPLLFRGMAFELMGDDDGAARAYERVLAIEPGYDPARAHMERARERLAAAGEPGWVLDGLRGTHAVAEGSYVAARRFLERAVQGAGAEEPSTAPQRDTLAAACYNLACVESLLSIGVACPGSGPSSTPSAEEATRLRDEAFACLERAVTLGLDNVHAMEGDVDLAPLRADPRWKAFVERIQGGGK
ncbi:MAG: protein kinase [Planctomycetota bacterium]